LYIHVDVRVFSFGLLPNCLFFRNNFLVLFLKLVIFN
jgi:hypothetical protein